MIQHFISINDFPIPVLGFAAFSGTGKTTLLKKLIPEMKSKGLRIGLIKQSHHDFEIDQPGKDSYELRKAGATQTLLTSPYRWALIHEHDDITEIPLVELLSKLDTKNLDIVFVEGFKQTRFPKIELNRKGINKPLLYPDDDSIIALVTDSQHNNHPIPVLDINHINGILDFICHYISGNKSL